MKLQKQQQQLPIKEKRNEITNCKRIMKNNILYKYVDVDTFLKIFSGEKALHKEVAFSEINPIIKLSSVADFRYNDYEDGLGYINDREFLSRLISSSKKFKMEISNLKLEGIEELRIYDNDALATLNELNIIYYSCIERKRSKIDSKEKRINSDYQKLISIYSNFKFSELVNQYLNKSVRRAHSFRDKFAEKYGIFCMTKNENNLAMWSHYCKNGGFVIAFDVNNKFFRQKAIIKEIEYSPVRPIVSSKDFDELSRNPDIIHPVFYTKDISWKYENEFRAFVKRSFCNILCPISLECIREVIVGFTEYPLSYAQFINKMDITKIDKNKKEFNSLRIKFSNIMNIISKIAKVGIEVNRLIPFGPNGYSKFRHHINEVSIEY